MIPARWLQPRERCGSMVASYGDGRPSRSVRATVRDCPEMQRPPTRTRSGDRPPVWKFRNRPMKCAAAVRQERPLGKPGGLFLWGLWMSDARLCGAALRAAPRPGRASNYIIRSAARFTASRRRAWFAAPRSLSNASTSAGAVSGEPALNGGAGLYSS